MKWKLGLYRGMLGLGFTGLDAGAFIVWSLPVAFLLAAVQSLGLRLSQGLGLSIRLNKWFAGRCCPLCGKVVLQYPLLCPAF